MNKRLNWYEIVNSEGTVLAVYGSALAEEARAKARELLGLGAVSLHLIASVKRPRVGDAARKAYLPIAF